MCTFFFVIVVERFFEGETGSNIFGGILGFFFVFVFYKTEMLTIMVLYLILKWESFLYQIRIFARKV